MVTDAAITEHLACLAIDAQDRGALLALAAIYGDAATTAEQRARIRRETGQEAVALAIEALVWDIIEGVHDVDDAQARLHLGLTLVAMGDGQPQPRDARRAVEALVMQARDAGITPKETVLAVQATASAGAAPLFDRRWRRGDGRFSRFVVQNVALDLLLAVGVVLAAALDAGLRGPVMAALFVVIGLGHATLLLRYMREG